MSRHSCFTAVALAAAALLMSLTGCSSLATRKGFYTPITAEVRAGRYAAALSGLEAARKGGKFAEKDRLLYYLDAGMLYHYAGAWDSSIARLHEAERAADELFTKSVSRAAASLLLNDNVLEYAGEDYEILYANLIKALDFLREEKYDDAFVEVRRANDKLQLLEQKYGDMAARYQRADSADSASSGLTYEARKVRFNNDAFARYLSMQTYAANGKLDDAKIDYAALLDAFRTQPNVYPFAAPEVKYTVKEGTLLNVVAMAGLCPTKEAMNLRLRTDKDLDLVQILYDGPDSADVEYGHLPARISEDYYFKFSIPMMVARPSPVSRVRVLANGKALGDLQLLEDVSLVAKETFEAKKAIIYVKTIARALTKGLATHKLKKKADTGGLGGWLKKAAIDVGADLIENADLRAAQYLPGLVYVGDFAMPPGQYDLVVQYLGSGEEVLAERALPASEVRSGRLNLFSTSWPN
jgi:uncharacterized protein